METLYHCKLCGRHNFVKKGKHRPPPGVSGLSCPGDFEPMSANSCHTCSFKKNKACPDPSIVTRSPWRGCGAWVEAPKEESQTLSVLSADQAARVDRAKSYHSCFHVSTEQAVSYAFLAGIEMNALKEGLPHGQWTKFREAHLSQISERSAQRYMAFADQIRHVADLPDLSGVKLLSNGRLPEKEEKKLLSAFHEHAEGKTLTQLYRDTGIIRDKKPVGRDVGDPPPKKLSAAEQRELAIRMATENFGLAVKGLLASNKDFFLLEDSEIQAQAGLAEFVFTIRRKWLALPKAKRDPKLLEAWLKDCPVK